MLFSSSRCLLVLCFSLYGLFCTEWSKQIHGDLTLCLFQTSGGNAISDPGLPSFLLDYDAVNAMPIPFSCRFNLQETEIVANSL